MNDQKANYEIFVKTAIRQLRNLNKSPGIHVVYSGFNNRFKDYYGRDANPIEVTQQLFRDGKIDMKPVKGGVMIYLPGEGPNKKLSEPYPSINDALQRSNDEERHNPPKKVIDTSQFIKSKTITTHPEEEREFQVWNVNDEIVERKQIKKIKPKIKSNKKGKCSCKKK